MHLVRHGEVENPRNLVYADLPGFHLSRRGQREAAWTGDFLASRPIEAVYSSPLDRAMETASVIAGYHGLEPKPIDRLTEWTLMNRWKGLPWIDLDTHRPGELERYLKDPTRMDFAPESLQDLADRIALTVAGLASRSPDGEIVAVSHQDPIQAARLVLTGQPLSDLHSAKPHHCEAISLAPGRPWSETGRIVPDIRQEPLGGATLPQHP